MLKERALALFFVLLLFGVRIGTAAAGDEPFVGAANWGGTGLMEIPTARVLREGRFRLGAGQISPYRYYYGAVNPLKGLEIEGGSGEQADLSFRFYDWFRERAFREAAAGIPGGEIPLLCHSRAGGNPDAHEKAGFPGQAGE